MPPRRWRYTEAREATQRTRALTSKEIDVMKMVIETGNYREAGMRLGIPRGTIAAIVFRIRSRYEKALYLCQQVQGYQSQLSKKWRKRRYFTG